MSTLGEHNTGLPRPYTLGTFQKRLNDFEDLINEITLQDVEATPEERRQMITENLRYDQFCDSIRALFGSDIKNQDLKALYRKISTNPDARVDWSELFGYFQDDTEEQEVTVGEEVNVFTISARRRAGEAAGDRKRRDVAICIKYVPSLDSYLVASQKGALSIWSSHEPAWVTGCDYMPVLRRVATCTERSICFWDNRAKSKNQIFRMPSQEQQVFVIKPLTNSPQCLSWVPLSNSIHEDTVVFGDDQGYLNVLTLAAKDLNMKNSKGDKKQENYFIDPGKLTHPIRRRKLHNDWVVKVKYFPELRCFGSCSPCGKSSFVLEELDRLLDDQPVRGVAIPKGVNAFDYCARANVLATGGVDKTIRIWHPHIFSRPTGKLIGHLFTVVDIVCNEKDQHVISLSTARVIRVWDLHTLTSLQVFTDNEERPGEKRIYSILFDNRHDRLLTGSSVVDCWPLTRSVQDTMQVPHTHDRAISQVLYNKELHQMVTVCTESVIRVWEAETGKQVYQILDAHGPNIEVTAITLDRTGYRLASGAMDGSIKVWDFGSGQEIKVKVGTGRDDDLSITGLQYCMMGRERCIIGMGWKNRLRLMQDSNDSNTLQVLHDFNDVHYMTREGSFSSQAVPFNKMSPLPSIGAGRMGSAQITNVFRKEYILSTQEITCMACQLPNIFATGCASGHVVLWDIEKSHVDKIFYLPEPTPSSVGSSRHSNLVRPAESPRAVHCLSILVHKVRTLNPEYIKKLTEQNSDDEIEAESQTRSERQEKKKTKTDTDNNKVENEQNKTPSAAAAQVTESSESKDEAEKTASHEESKPDSHTNDTDEKDCDPDGHMKVETFDPILVTCHQDSFIRFWSLQGVLLREISAVTRRQGSPVTALTHDEDCNILVTGDHKGYLTLWKVDDFLKDTQTEDRDAVKQLMSWRAHLTRVVQLQYINSLKAIISGSTDGSVRIWWGRRGRFVGFYGQHRQLQFPTSEVTSGSPVLPYDISEGPLAPVKKISARQRLRGQKYEYPLIFDNKRWEPFHRSSYGFQSEEKKEPEDKKFFAALIKPRPYNYRFGGYTSRDIKQGAVFRSLPVYQVEAVQKPKVPEIGMTSGREDDSYLFQATRSLYQTVQGAKAARASREAKLRKRKQSQFRGPFGRGTTHSSRNTSAATSVFTLGTKRK